MQTDNATFTHLLTPLDGSHLAEAVLPAARYWAQALHATVTLFHVIERNAPETVHGDRHITQPAEANAYLAAVAQTFAPDVPINYHVHADETRNVARNIVDHAKELRADLVVLCTHGKGGLHTWLFGSIAQQVIALGNTPVLLIHPEEHVRSAPFACRRLLTPLDGDPEHEQGIQVAVHLAQKLGAELHLVMVVATRDTLPNERLATARLLPGATAAFLDITEQGAQAYVAQQVAQLKGLGLTVTSAVRRGDPATAIAEDARQTQADLIVLGTHGKSHMDAFWSGSTTPKLSNRTKLPLLLVPVR